MKKTLFSLLLLATSNSLFGQLTWKEFNVATQVDTTNIKNNTDFSVKGKIAWDNKFIYLNFDVTDDSIFAVGTENTWMLDNLEIYFDMNNVKSPAFPRGQSIWPSSYDKQAGSWQLRLIPGTMFDSVNKSNKGWCIENYNVTADGYKYELKFHIDSLLKGYIPEIGKIIGFDVLASDNDNAPNYRDQLSFHAKLGSIWCDAASWGTIKFAANGSFDVVYDEIKPSKITNLKATKNNKQVMLTWDPATDNIVVEKYVVFVNKQKDTAIYAQKTGNAYVVKGIDQNKDYTFSVAAIDVEGNQSDTVSVNINTVGMNNFELSNISIYPNPSASFISLNNRIAVSIEVYNSSGQLVIIKLLNAGEKVDISSLVKGVYSVKVIESNRASVLRLIKK